MALLEARAKVKFAEGWQTGFKYVENSHNPTTHMVAVQFPNGKFGFLLEDRVEYRGDDGEWISTDPDTVVSQEEIDNEEQARNKFLIDNKLCLVCSEPIPPTGKRGRPRRIHEECIEVGYERDDETEEGGNNV